MTDEYKTLVCDVAGPTQAGYCHIDTAMLEAEDEYDVDEILKEVGKTKNDLRMDAIKLARQWNQRKDGSE